MKLRAKIPVNRGRLPQPATIESALAPRVSSDFGSVAVTSGFLLRHNIEVAGFTATSAVVSTCLPQDYLENRASLSSWWKTVLDDLTSHTAYVECEVETARHSSIVDAAVLLTHIVAVYVRQTEGLGVY